MLQVHLGTGGDDPGQGALVRAQPCDGLPDHLLKVPLGAGEAPDDRSQRLEVLVLGISLQILWIVELVRKQVIGEFTRKEMVQCQYISLLRTLGELCA